MARLRVGEHDAVGNVGLGQRGGENLAGEIAGLVGIAFSAAGAAAQAEGNGVLAENVGQALDFAGVGHGDKHLLAFANVLLDFLEHRRNRAVKARCGLRRKAIARLRRLRSARDAQVLNVGARQGRRLAATSPREEDTDPRAAPDCRRRCARALLRCETRSDQTLARS